MRAWTLGSGSRGNAIVLECGSTRILVDAGYPARTLARRLAAANIAPESISAVVVTHEHIDHSRGVAPAHARWAWQVFGTAGTLAGIDALPTGSRNAIEPGTPFAIGDFDITLVRVPHDATAPTAILLTGRQSGFRAAVAHDLGMVPDGLRGALSDLDLLLIESNHDDHMLRSGPYPAFLQQRIASRTGHLSNHQTAELVGSLKVPTLSALVLLHLSEKNNTPAIATASAKQALQRAGGRCQVTAAPQGDVAGPYGDVNRRPQQFALAI